MGNPALNWCGDGCFEDYATRICLTGNYNMHNTPGSANPSDPSQSFSGKLEENNTCRNSINNSWATSAECGFYSYTVSNLGFKAAITDDRVVGERLYTVKITITYYHDIFVLAYTPGIGCWGFEDVDVSYMKTVEKYYAVKGFEEIVDSIDDVPSQSRIVISAKVVGWGGCHYEAD